MTGIETDKTSDKLGVHPTYWDRAERPHPIKDRCWATPISVLGVVAAGAAAYAMKKGQYEIAAGLTTVSGLADWRDGEEARRYAKRRPVEAADRAHSGIVTDKVCDKIRNIILGGAIALDKNYSTPARVAAGLVTVREVVVSVASLKVAAKLKEEGVPTEELDSMPSSPIGKETMWEFGGGFALATGGVIANKHGASSLGNSIENLAAGTLTLGFARGVESGIEYTHAFNQKVEALRIGDTEWQPDYKPHIGTYAVNAIRYIQNVASDAHGAEAAEEGYVVAVTDY